MEDVCWGDPSVPALRPCLLCGGQPEMLNDHSLPPRMSGKPGAVVSAEIIHRCGAPEAVKGGLVISLRHRGAIQAAAAWNEAMRPREGVGEPRA